MNRLALTIAFVVSLGAAARGQHGLVTPDLQNPRIVAGQVDGLGNIIRGSHFTIEHLRTGEYRLRLDRVHFLNSCPIITITDGPGLGVPPVYRVSQRDQLRCSRTFQLYFYDAQSLSARDTDFNFVAVGSD